MKRVVAIAAIVALAGCDALPRDTAGTNDRIASDGRFRAGLVAATPANDLVDRIEARVSAAARNGEHRWIAEIHEAVTAQ